MNDSEHRFWVNVWDWVLTRAEYLERRKEADGDTRQDDTPSAQTTLAQKPECIGSVSQ